jgi:hypothetical protein
MKKQGNKSVRRKAEAVCIIRPAGASQENSFVSAIKN